MNDLADLQTDQSFASLAASAPLSSEAADVPNPDTSEADERAAAMALLDGGGAEGGEPEGGQSKTEPAPNAFAKSEAWVSTVVRERKQAAAQMAAVRRERDQMKADLEAAREYRELQEEIKTNPLGASRKLKLDTNRVWEQVLEEDVNSQPLTPEEQFNKKAAELEARVNAWEKAQADKEIAQRKEANKNALLGQVQNIHNQAQRIANEDTSNRYELIKTYSAYPAVLKAAATYYDANNGQFPDTEIVMQAIEESMRNELKKAVSNPYVRSLLQELAEPRKTNPADLTMGRGMNPKPASLTNARNPSSLTTKDRELTDEELRDEAIKALLG